MTEQTYSQRVLKHELAIGSDFYAPVARGSKFVHVGVQIRDGVDGQYEVPCMWTLEPIDGIAEAQSRTFCVKGTGFGVEDGLEYIGTFLLNGGAFVGHVFERVGEADES